MIQTEELVALRRDFHHHAESKWQEFRTSSRIAQYLTHLGIPVLLGTEICVPHMGFGMPDEAAVQAAIDRAIAQGADPALVARMEGHPGVVGIIETGVPGPVVALRFDIDSLPFGESDDPGHRPAREGFASINPSCCHACGHDGHTTIGLGTARELMGMRQQLKGTIKLIFQPAEEGGGGARGIVARGILDDVDYLFGGHLALTYMNGMPIPSHALAAGVKDFLDTSRYEIDFIGRAAHPCTDPQNGKNALLAACQATLGIHSIAPSSEGILRVNVGMFQGGVSRNTIAPCAHLDAEMRAENDRIAAYGDEKLRAAVQGAAAMYQVDCDIRCIGRTVSGQSDDRAMELVMKCAREIPWFEHIEPLGSIGGTDDVSDMLRRVQAHGGCGTYFGLGADIAASLHNSLFDFDEDVLAPAVELYCRLVQAVLSVESR